MELTDKELARMSIYEAIARLPGCDDSNKVKDQRLQLYERWKNAHININGWVVDLVGGHDDMPFGMDLHTHGLLENYNHPDLQLVLPLDRKLMNSIIRTCVDMVKDGTKFEPGKPYSKIVKGMDVGFAEAVEDDRMVLRLIFPDKNGNWSRDTIAGDLVKQFEGTIDANRTPLREGETPTAPDDQGDGPEQPDEASG